MQESYALLNVLHFFLDVRDCIFENFVVSQLVVLVEAPYELQHTFCHVLSPLSQLYSKDD